MPGVAIAAIWVGNYKISVFSVKFCVFCGFQIACEGFPAALRQSAAFKSYSTQLKVRSTALSHPL